MFLQIGSRGKLTFTVKKGFSEYCNLGDPIKASAAYAPSIGGRLRSEVVDLRRVLIEYDYTPGFISDYRSTIDDSILNVHLKRNVL